MKHIIFDTNEKNTNVTDGYDSILYLTVEALHLHYVFNVH